MKRGRVLPKTIVLFMCLSFAAAYYPESNLRCRAFGINYNDCLKSIYRPNAMYDSYLRSFNLPIRKDSACSYAPCQIAILGSGLERILSIAKNMHPPGDCICLGVTSCGCEDVSEPPADIKTMYTMPSTPIHTRIPEIITRTVEKTRTVQVTHTKLTTLLHHLTSSAVSRQPRETPRISPEEMLSALDDIGYIKKYLAGPLPVSSVAVVTPMLQATPHVPITPNNLYAQGSTPPAPSNAGSVITIPYTTVTSTVQVTVPSYTTITRSQYVINTVDNYITETKTKTLTSTSTKKQTETITTTATETISDHVERVRFSTLYLSKTITVDKVSVTTKTISNTVSVTATVAPSIDSYTRPKSISQGYASPDRPHSVRPRPLKYSMPRQRSQMPTKKYYMVKPEIKKRMVCRRLPSGCIDAQQAMSGECKIGSNIPASCPPPQTFSGFRQPVTIPQSTGPKECTTNCEEVTTVYVRAKPTAKV